MAHIPTTYALFAEWFAKTYNRPFTASEDEFNAALKQPATNQSPDWVQQTVAYTQRDFEIDVARERYEGWGYDWS